MKIAYVNIFVSDLPGAKEFYEGKLGLNLELYSPEQSYASFSAGDMKLGIAVPGAEQAKLIGRHTGVGFVVSDLEAEHARLSSLGVNFPMPPTEQPWGGFMALIADPDGNVFYLDQIAASK